MGSFNQLTSHTYFALFYTAPSTDAVIKNYKAVTKDYSGLEKYISYPLNSCQHLIKKIFFNS